MSIPFPEWAGRLLAFPIFLSRGLAIDWQSRFPGWIQFAPQTEEETAAQRAEPYDSAAPWPLLRRGGAWYGSPVVRASDNHRVAGDLTDLERGRASYANESWQAAFESLSAADQVEPLGTADHELLARSAYMLGRDDEYVGALELRTRQAGRCRLSSSWDRASRP